jgi:hypothetical protein
MKKFVIRFDVIDPVTDRCIGREFTAPIEVPAEAQLGAFNTTELIDELRRRLMLAEQAAGLNVGKKGSF